MKQFEKRVNKLLLEVIDEAKSVGIPISSNINLNVIINTRAKNRFGACRRKIINNKEHFQIEIGSALNNCTDFQIKSLLAHEILHTCPRCYNHGQTWKAYSDILNKKYKYQIKRVSDPKEFNIQNIQKEVKYRYKIICTKCGNEIYRQKRTKVIANIENYRCKCGGRLKVEKIN